MAKTPETKPGDTKITEPIAKTPDPAPKAIVDPPKSALAPPPPAPPPTPALTQSDIDAAIMSERERCTSILEACGLADVKESSMDMINDGSTIETAHKMIMAILAERSAASPVRSAVNPATSGQTNPILADAIRRAEKAKA